MPDNKQPPTTDPISELFYKLDAANKYLEKVADKPDEHKQAAIDALVTDLMPGLQRMTGALSKFINDTISVVQHMDGRVTGLEQAASEINDRLEAVESPEASILMPEDAEVLHNFVAASLGVISKTLPTTDPAREALLDLGKKAIKIINEARVAEEEEEEEQEDGDTSGG